MALGDKYYILIFDSEKEARQRVTEFRKRNKCEEIISAGDDMCYMEKLVVKVRIVEDGSPNLRKALFVHENQSRIFNFNFKPNVKELLERTHADKQ